MAQMLRDVWRSMTLTRRGQPRFSRFCKGSKCEELRSSKSGPLCPDERTFVRGGTTSQMGQRKKLCTGDRRTLIATSIRIYALVARGHRLPRDGHRRKRREIRVLVVTDPYARIGDEPVSGGDRVA